MGVLEWKEATKIATEGIFNVYNVRAHHFFIYGTCVPR